MSQNAFSAIAALAALTFLAMALSGCVSSEQVQLGEPLQIAAADLPSGLPEFHGARIGQDALRSRLPTE